ncbi:MAG TPA: hypothetical protein VGB53_14620 [Rubricoccaceae bacterium]|jgi:hypothetical protein
MDVVKVFVEDPAALGGGAPLGAGNPDMPPPGGEPPDASAEAFLARLRAPASPFARAYLAGTALADAATAPHRVGLTAISAPEAFVEPLVAWAAGRTWTRLTVGGRASGILEREAREALADPARTALLALGPGPIPDDILATVVFGDAAHSADALRTLLLADASVAVFTPQPAHDGQDWAVVARSPLRAGLVAAFRACPAPAGVRRFVVPRVRGEAKFYFEQWALSGPMAGALPAGTEEL